MSLFNIKEISFFNNSSNFCSHVICFSANSYPIFPINISLATDVTSSADSSNPVNKSDLFPAYNLNCKVERFSSLQLRFISISGQYSIFISYVNTYLCIF